MGIFYSSTNKPTFVSIKNYSMIVNTMKFGIENFVFESVLSLNSDLGQVTKLF